MPYGNLDVPAVVAHDPALLPLARAQQSTVLDDLGITTSPVLAAPGGYVDAASVRASGDDTRILVGDDVVPGRLPAVADLDGHSMVVTSSGAMQGSPGPGSALTVIGLRQRILAEAAIRALTRDQPPLTVMLPTTWALGSSAEFFSGLDADWLDLETVSSIQDSTPATSVTDDDLDYPAVQQRRQLDPLTFDTADSLIDRGATLQRVLTQNTEVAGSVTEQALTALSYSARRSQASTRESMVRSRDWLDDRLGQVRITASAGVTLSSASGTFLVSVVNDLDQTVTVTVVARSDPGLTVDVPDPIELEPGVRTNVLLEARSTSNKVHNVTLEVADATGVPLGASDRLPIRSSQVSDIIWLIMGTGVAILFLAIGLRLYRRIRDARRGTSPAVAAPPETT